MGAFSPPPPWPRLSLLRLVGTGGTALVGYLYYKFSQASNWLGEQLDTFNEWGLATILSVADVLESWKQLLPAPRQRSPDIFNAPEEPKENIGNDTNYYNQEEASPTTEEEDEAGHFGDFIKKMIEVRTTLRDANLPYDGPVDPNSQLMLPSIVVIGSQSAGKSSVLESIVGHEFLPKGTNMVTRRPIELTLVHSNVPRDYAIIDNSIIYDFAEVRRKLDELNASVSSTEWISNTPIDLVIHSRHVPDLTLVDLPGYIAVTSRNQPPQLREQIATLCDRYIRPGNLILAVCAADVDLANAEALQAARQVDPRGERTIGVLTKLDLVEPRHAVDLLRSDAYPLRLGYVGVVCRPLVKYGSRNYSTESATDSSLGSSIGSSVLSILSPSSSSRSEANKRQHGIPTDVYFTQNHQILTPVKDQLGFDCLRKKLTAALERSMASSLGAVLGRVQNELREVNYALKVEYNDRPLHPEAYVGHLTGSVRLGLERVSRDYTRAKVRLILRRLLEERLLAVCQEIIFSIHKDVNNHQTVEMAIDQLTRSGLGRLVAHGLVDAMVNEAKNAIREGPLAAHPTASERLVAHLESSMRQRCQVAVEQVENALKPLKHWQGEVMAECGNGEWRRARSRLLWFLAEVEGEWTRQTAELQEEIGLRRLKRILERLSQELTDKIIEVPNNNHNEAGATTIPVKSPLVIKAQQLVELNSQLKALRQRIGILKSRECGTITSGRKYQEKREWWRWVLSKFSSSATMTTATVPLASSPVPLTIIHCPEIYLYVMMEKLLNTAALHAHHELVYEFLHPFPQELISSSTASPFSAKNLNDREELLKFLRENPLVYRHYQLQERRRILEEVRDKLQFLQQLSHNTGHGDYEISGANVENPRHSPLPKK